MAYDMSPWGQYAPPIQGAQGAPSPISGVAAGAGAMPQMNQGWGGPGGVNQGFAGGPGSMQAPAGMIPRPGGTMGLPFGGGGFTNPGIMGGMFNGAGQMRPQGNPMQMLLPFLLQHMGAMNRPGGGPAGFGGPGGVPGSMNIILPGGGPGGVNQGAVGAPGGGGGLIPRPGGTMTDPQRIMYGQPSAQPYVDKSGVAGSPGTYGIPTGSPMGPAAAAFLPGGGGGSIAPRPGGTSVLPGSEAIPPAAGNATGQTFGGLPTGIPMSLQTQVNAMTPQGQVQNALNNYGGMGPMQMMMAQLLRQQLPFG